MTTNYERIKNMNIEEMAEFIDDWFSCSFCEFILNCRDSFYPSCIDYCVEERPKKIKQWLQAESENNVNRK